MRHQIRQIYLYPLEQLLCSWRWRVYSNLNLCITTTWLNEWNTLVKPFYTVDPKFNTKAISTLTYCDCTFSMSLISSSEAQRSIGGRDRVDCMQWTGRTDCQLKMNQLRLRNDRLEVLDLRKNLPIVLTGICGIIHYVERTEGSQHATPVGLKKHSDFDWPTDCVHQILPRHWTAEWRDRNCWS
jgi:hypothetical protein